MERLFPNDMHISIAGRHVRLRASIGALCAIEQRLLMPLSALVDQSLNTAQARIILHEALSAAGHTGATFADDEPHLIEYAQRYLKQNMQHLPDASWQELFLIYAGVMNRAAQEFWTITLAEYTLITEGFCMMHGFEPQSALPPATSQDLAEMIKRFV